MAVMCVINGFEEAVIAGGYADGEESKKIFMWCISGIVSQPYDYMGGLCNNQ
jgi:hypothetical protein